MRNPLAYLPLRGRKNNSLNSFLWAGPWANSSNEAGFVKMDPILQKFNFGFRDTH